LEWICAAAAAAVIFVVFVKIFYQMWDSGFNSTKNTIF